MSSGVSLGGFRGVLRWLPGVLGDLRISSVALGVLGDLRVSSVALGCPWVSSGGFGGCAW